MSKILVVYYSYTNHTKMIAERIKKEINCDLLEIEPEEEYSRDYDYVVDIAQDEANKKYMPKLKLINIDLKDYDTIVIGTPVWWYTYAPPIRTFLYENDFSNKKVIPFATHAGWLGHTLKDFKKMCPKANVCNEFDIRFTEDYSENKILTSDDSIKEWINSIK